MHNQEVTLENIDKLLDRKIDGKIQPEFEYIHQRIDQGFQNLSDQLAIISDHGRRLNFLERFIRMVRNATTGVPD